jgi:hypothetical protein
MKTTYYGGHYDITVSNVKGRKSADHIKLAQKAEEEIARALESL